MENEWSVFVKMGIRLSVISIVLGVLIFLFGLSKQIPNAATRKVDNAYVATVNYEWKALKMHNEPLPAISVYAMILKDESKLKSISGVAHGVHIHSASDLQKLLSKQIMCSVTDTGNGNYILVISES